MRHRALCLLALACGLAACQPDPSAKPVAAVPPPTDASDAAAPTAPDIPKKDGQTTTYRYQCGELDVTANFRGEGDAEFVFNGRVLKLPHVPAASGARYADAQGNEFWSKGEAEARLTLQGQPPRTCVGPGAMPA